jgi:hypothetical protein
MASHIEETEADRSWRSAQSGAPLCGSDLSDCADERAEAIRAAHAHVFDMSELDAPRTTLADFLAVNAECPPDDGERLELARCPVGGEVRLGIGGGYVTVRRIS